jgi:hypothetical protein
VAIDGFADDLVLSVTGDSKEQVEVCVTRAIGTVVNWMTEHKLEIAHAKTEMVWLAIVSKSEQLE